jgi:hypothetical protein
MSKVTPEALVFSKVVWRNTDTTFLVYKLSGENRKVIEPLGERVCKWRLRRTVHVIFDGSRSWSPFEMVNPLKIAKLLFGSDLSISEIASIDELGTVSRRWCAYEDYMFCDK